MQVPDAELVQLARDGSVTALRALFDRYWPYAWRVAFVVLGDRAAASDVAQETLDRLFRSLDRYDPSRALRPWVRRIALNAALDEARRRQRAPATVDWSAELVGAVDADPFDDEVARALAKLSPERRLVVVLRYWAGLRLDEIAEATSLPVGTVASRLSRALAELRSILEADHVAC